MILQYRNTAHEDFAADICEQLIPSFLLIEHSVGYEYDLRIHTNDHETVRVISCVFVDRILVVVLDGSAPRLSDL